MLAGGHSPKSEESSDPANEAEPVETERINPPSTEISTFGDSLEGPDDIGGSEVDADKAATELAEPEIETEDDAQSLAERAKRSSIQVPEPELPRIEPHGEEVASPDRGPQAGSNDGEAKTDHLRGIDLVEKLAEGVRRDDLVERVQAARALLDSAEARVVVTGEFKQGKSSLVNALLATEVCPVDGVSATQVPTILRYGVDLSAAWVGFDDSASTIHASIDTDRALRDAILEDGESGGDRDAAAVEVRLPRRLLASGLSIVDTPGVGGLSSPEAATATAMAKNADAVLFVSDLTQELTAPELEYLVEIERQARTVICVFTKADLTTAGSVIVERNRSHLERQGLSHLPHVVVSSMLHAFAVEHGDAELEEESGFEALFDLLKRRALDNAKTRVARTARAELELISSQLELEAEAARRAADGDAAQVTTELDDAAKRTILARSDTAQWRKELATGIKHLQGDARQDRQKRRLALQRWIENVLEEEAAGSDDSRLEDDDFIELLHRQLVTITAEHFDHVQGLIDQLAETVHELYATESLDPIDLVIDPEFAPTVDLRGTPKRATSSSRTRSLLAIAQSSSSGMMVASTAVGVSTTGLSLVGVGASIGAAVALGPLLLGAPVGVMFAMRAVRDDRKRRRDLTIHEMRKRAMATVQEAWLDFDFQSQRSIDEAQTLLREAIEHRSRQVEQTLVHASQAAQRIGRAHESGKVGPELKERIGAGQAALETMRTQRPQGAAV
jgi:GTPase SAR1 family protein